MSHSQYADLLKKKKKKNKARTGMLRLHHTVPKVPASFTVRLL